MHTGQGPLSPGPGQRLTRDKPGQRVFTPSARHSFFEVLCDCYALHTGPAFKKQIKYQEDMKGNRSPGPRRSMTETVHLGLATRSPAKQVPMTTCTWV